MFNSTKSTILLPIYRRLSSRRMFSLNSPERLQFVQFSLNTGSQKLGVTVDQKYVINLNEKESPIPNTMVEFLQRKTELEPYLKKAIEKQNEVYDINSIKLLAPVTKPDKVICVGLNYKGHCDEQNKPYPEQPFFFSKFPSTIIGPRDKLQLPTKSKAVDWEVELTVVIGKEARNVPVEQAYEYIFGYTIAQDISARDWQTPKRNNGQWLFAKSLDQFCPLGPAITTTDVIGDPHNLIISCSVNGVEKQKANTDELIHRVDKLISYLSELITLLPGDIILTGTPNGVGVFRNPREFLKAGDTIVSEISSIGKLETKVV